jgi:hypothetical protein
MSLFKYIFLFVIGYAVWRLLDSVFASRTGPTRQPPSGGTQTGPKQNPKPRIPDTEGDYIDFEETK